MKKQVLWCLCAVFLTVSCGVDVFADPVKFSAGPYLRLRYEYWNNIYDMADTSADLRRFYRFKAAVWGKMDVNKNLSAYARITNESRSYLDYFSNNVAQDTTYNIGEAVIDNLYVDIKQIFNAPLDLRIGRQDMLNEFGDGFLIQDGTPVDGSRTFYFNAVKAAWAVQEKASINLVYIRQNKYDVTLPILNEITGRQALAVTDESAVALFHKTDTIQDMHWENYAIWKQEEGGGAAASFNADENRLTTIGSYAKYALDSWTFKAQLAFQSGSYGAKDRQAYGGYGYVEKSFGSACCKPVLTVGGIYLTGDDPSTTAVESWDPLFSRWPVPSELLLLSYAKETSIGYWANMTAYRAGVNLVPAEKTKLGIWYNWFLANYSMTPGALFGSGKDRGKLVQARVDYSFTKNISAYLLGEHFTPGDFYVDGSNPALFVRTELQFKY